MKPFNLQLWPGLKNAAPTLSGPAIVDQIVIDTRRADSSQALFVALPGKNHDGHHFIPQADELGIRYALVSESWQPPKPLKQLQLLKVKDPLTAFQEIVSCYRQGFPSQVIAITGSHGKTMIKDLLYSLISTTYPCTASPGSFNSQIGVPLSLLTLNDAHRIALIEVGVSEPGEMNRLGTTIRPNHAILSNVAKAHAPYFPTLEVTAQEKIKLFDHLHPSGWGLLPSKISSTASLKCRTHFWDQHTSDLPQVRFLTDSPTDAMTYEILFPSGNRFHGTISSGFNYLLDNISIAVKAAYLLDIPEQAIIQTLADYYPEPMHTEIWKSPLGPTFINDTYCSDPLSVDLALQTLQLAPKNGRKVFVFGGFRNDTVKTATNYKLVGRAIRQAGIDHLMLFGNQDYTPLCNALNERVTYKKWDHYEEVVEAMREQLHSTDTVLIKGPYKQSIDALMQTWHDSPCDNRYAINLAAIASNVHTFKSLLPPQTRLMVMIKASAYGTDAIPLAKFLAQCGVDILGLSYADEAIVLKHAGATQELFVLNGSIHEAAKIVKWDLQVGVSNRELIHALATQAQKAKKKVKLHLHIDTGMNRFGCRPEEALSLAKEIVSHPLLILEGVMTHFSSADEPEADSFSQRQIERFFHAVEEIKREGIAIPWVHVANSAGALRFALPGCNMARVGFSIFGLPPSLTIPLSVELRPALTLTSRIVGINVCKKGEAVSYGRHYQIERDIERIAMLPIGYYDGLHRHYSGKGSVIIRGQKAPMIGKICMDYMMVNVTDIPSAAIGDTALIFGQDDHGQSINPEDFASQGGSIPHELISCLGPRLPRVFLL